MKTIRAEWISFKHKNIPANAPKEVLLSAEYTFYSGVAAMLDGFMLLGSGKIKEPDTVVNNWAKEMVEYANERNRQAKNMLQ